MGIFKRNILSLAEMIARKAHRSQFRWNGEQYITHPEAVSRLMLSPELKVVAWLHDVLEDTDTTPGYLYKKGIPLTLIRIIELLTKKKGDNYKEYILGLFPSQDAIIVKLADLKHNLSDLKPGHMKDKYLLAEYILKQQLSLLEHKNVKEEKTK